MRNDIDRAVDRALDEIDTLSSCPVIARLMQSGNELSARLSKIALSITAAEAALRNPVERIFEYALLTLPKKMFSLVGDVSIGPAQIRQSHFNAANLQGFEYFETVAYECESLEFVVEWLRSQDQKKKRFMIENALEWTGMSALPANNYERTVYVAFIKRVAWEVADRFDPRR